MEICLIDFFYSKFPCFSSLRTWLRNKVYRCPFPKLHHGPHLLLYVSLNPHACAKAKYKPKADFFASLMYTVFLPRLPPDCKDEVRWSTRWSFMTEADNATKAICDCIFADVLSLFINSCHHRQMLRQLSFIFIEHRWQSSKTISDLM